MRCFVLTLFLAVSLDSLACAIDSNQFYNIVSYAKKNERLKKSSFHTFSIITEKEFYDFISKVEQVYSLEFKKLKRNLKIHASWSDNGLNAYASQVGKDSLLYLSGGYARTRFMTRDAYYTVICHELGHHLGGFPKQKIPVVRWSSAEGQADYYSTAKCMKTLLRGDFLNKKIAQSILLPKKIKKLCREQFQSQDDYFVCLRSAKAAEDYGQMMYYLKYNEEPFNFVNLEFKDQSEVLKTSYTHPEPQCRLDTKLEGALCNVSELVSFSNKEELTGSCHKILNHTIGIRPACWFKGRD